MGGNTTSCLRDTICASSRFNAALHCLQKFGLCSTISSGFSFIVKVVPSCPGCPPVLRVVGSREFFLLLLPISCDGGVELVLLLRPFFKSCICSCKDLFCSCKNCICNRNSATRIFNPLYSTNGMVIVSMRKIFQRRKLISVIRKGRCRKKFHRGGVNNQKRHIFV